MAKRVLREWRCGLLWQEPPDHQVEQQRIEFLEKIETTDEVLAELMESMTEAGIEVILQRAWEKYPEANSGSSPTMDHSSLLGISRNSFASPR